jgi:N-acyl homoserine lactone hydrolase
MSVKAEPRGLHEPLEGGREGATVVVEPLLCGEIQLPPAFFEKPAGRFWLRKYLGLGVSKSDYWWVPIPAFLVHHPGAGPVLVDTGLHPSVATDPKQNMGLMTRLAEFRVDPDQPVPARLRARDLEPADVRVVVLTHLHTDHASGISEFPHATFVVAEAEWHAATTDKRPQLRGYRHQQFDFAFDYRTIDYDRGDVSSYETFGRSFDLFGDGSVRLVSTPGHSAGHQSVIARLSDSEFVIAGDAIYTYRQLEGGNEPPRPIDRHNWRRSLRELQLFRREHPDCVIVPGHDPEHWKTIAERYD